MQFVISISRYYRESSCVYTPQQNGMWRWSINIFLFSKRLKFQAQFWKEYILTVTYTLNRVSTPSLKGKSPFEVLLKKTTIVSDLKTFGALCYATTLDSKINAALEPLLVCLPGIVTLEKGHKLDNLESNSFLVSRDVIFYENTFHLLIHNWNSHFLSIYLCQLWISFLCLLHCSQMLLSSRKSSKSGW